MFVRKSTYLRMLSLNQELFANNEALLQDYINAVGENDMLWARLHAQATKPAFKGGAWRDKDGKFTSAKKSRALL